MCSYPVWQSFKLFIFTWYEEGTLERAKEWFLNVGDHIVEFSQALRTFPDGSEGEVKKKSNSNLVFIFQALLVLYSISKMTSKYVLLWYCYLFY